MAKQYKQKTSPISYKPEIKILANPGLAYLGFEQPGPGVFIQTNTTHTSYSYWNHQKKASSTYIKFLICIAWFDVRHDLMIWAQIIISYYKL